MKTFRVHSVIFDMDGVITDTMPYHLQAWMTIFHRLGVRVNKNDIYKREGQKGLESVKEILAEYQFPFDMDIALKMLTDKEELFKQIFKRKFIQGSRPFLRKLKKNKFKLALVTGTSRHEAQKLLPEDIWNLFDCTVCGSDVNLGKPHPEPYLKALDGLNLNPQEGVVFENAPFGIRSAKEAGLPCIAIATSLPKTYLHEADLIISSYNEIPTTLTIERL